LPVKKEAYHWYASFFYLNLISLSKNVKLYQKEERMINMLDKKVSKLINEQVNKEFYSAYLYLDFSNYYYEAGLDGFGNWYKVQAQEERDHAMLMMQYLQNAGEKLP